VPLTARSRYASAFRMTPSVTETAEFVQSLAEMSDSSDVLIPITTNTVLAVARNRGTFKAATLLPDAGRLEMANDKGILAAFARGGGVDVPETVRPASRDEAAKAATKLGFPVVLKLANDEGLFVGPAARYRIVSHQTQLSTAYDELTALKPQVLVQRYISGEACGFAALFDRESKPVAFFCHRRIREYPITGGPSSMCEGIRDEKLIETGLKLLTALSWQGVAQVEFKRESSSGKFFLMEINPRFWGSLPLATASGVNFPMLMCRVALGENVVPVTRYSVGRRLRFVFMDAAAFVSTVKSNGPFDPRAMGFVSDLLDLGVTDGVFDLADPFPALSYLISRF
jgi:predicted ATP-grasp superfamily ATP-dependent carboligase